MLQIPDRAILVLTGPDTLALLERTVTHTVGDWVPGAARYGALLTPQGKVIADYIAHRTPEGVLLDVHADAADDLAKRLKLFRLRADVVIERAAGLAVMATEAGPPDPRSAALPRRAIMAAEPGGDAFPGWAARAIAAGVPEWGADYRAADVFPTDINMDQMGGIDYRKGCFVGQEVASRMKRKGVIRKRTIGLTGAGLLPGTDVVAGETRLGAVTRGAGTDGLALVRIDRLAQSLLAGAALTCAGEPVTLRCSDWLASEIDALGRVTSDD